MKRLDKIADYTVLGALGKGGMGVVYIGFDEKKNRFAALKILSDQIAPDPVAVQRFQREGQLYEKMSHPNIVASYDSGQFHGQYYIALELVQGKALNDIVAAGSGGGPPLSIVASLEIYRSLVSALQAAHAIGVVHRDLKPHNVIINPFGVTKLLDFGVAQVTDDDMNLTKTGLIIGTLLYASPEQNQGKAVDGRSDLYSLGIMLYEMMSGKRLFKGSNVGEIILQQIQCTSVSVSKVVPGLPAEFDTYFGRLIHPMLTARVDNARAALTELDALVKSLGPEGRKVLYGSPTEELWFASRLQFVRREYEKSEELARKVLEAGMENPNIFLLLGRIARERQDERKMVESFTKVLQMVPGDNAARLEYILALNAFGKRELATKEIETLLKVDPTNPYATGLRDLFSHQVRWMSREEVEARKKAVLHDGPAQAEEKTPEATAEEAAAKTAEFAAKVAAAMRKEAASFDPAAVAKKAWFYPGAGQFENRQKKEGAIYALLAVVCVVAIGWALVTGLDFHLPVYDVMKSFSSDDSMIGAIESNLEERVNTFFSENSIFFLTGMLAFFGAILFWIWTTSISRAVAYAKRKSLLGQVTKVIGGGALEIDVGSDRGAAIGNVFSVVQISRLGKVPIGTARLNAVQPDTAVASFVPLARPTPVTEGDDGDEPAAADTPPPQPRVGDVAVPTAV